jgi:hypothetical protein
MDSDYIAFLRDIAEQQVDPQKRAANISNYKAIRARQFGLDHLPSSKILDWVDQDPATAQTRYLREMIYDPIVKLLPPRDQEKLANASLIALPNRSVNGCSLRSPNGDPLIVIDSGLLSLLSFWYERKVEAQRLANTRPFSDVVEFNGVTYNFLLDNYRADGVYAYLPPSSQTPPDLLTYAMFMTTAAEIFVVLHEIGHIIAGHLNTSPANNFRMFPAQQPGAATLDMKIYEHPWKAEHEADGIAWLAYQNIWPRHEYFSKIAESSKPILLKQAPLHFFEYVALIETNIPPSDAVPTHPPAVKRLQMLLGVTDQILHDSELLDWGRLILETCSQMPIMNEGAAR